MCGLTIGIVVFRQDKRSLHDSMAATYVKHVDPTKTALNLFKAFLKEQCYIFNNSIISTLLHFKKEKLI
jgi:hypothetical protein